MPAAEQLRLDVGAERVCASSEVDLTDAMIAAYGATHGRQFRS